MDGYCGCVLSGKQKSAKIWDFKFIFNCGFLWPEECAGIRSTAILDSETWVLPPRTCGVHIVDVYSCKYQWTWKQLLQLTDPTSYNQRTIPLPMLLSLFLNKFALHAKTSKVLKEIQHHNPTAETSTHLPGRSSSASGNVLTLANIFQFCPKDIFSAYRSHKSGFFFGSTSQL